MSACHVLLALLILPVLPVLPVPVYAFDPPNVHSSGALSEALWGRKVATLQGRKMAEVLAELLAEGRIVGCIVEPS